jgi:probable HAF family extracellular repeat protein
MVDLGTLGGAESWGQDAAAFVSTRYVAGYSLVRVPDPNVGGVNRPNPSSSWYVYHAFRWSPQQGMIDLGAAGGLHSFGFGVNEFGDVVGQIVNLDQEDRAFFWTEQGGFINLGTLGGNGSFAFSVNTCGNTVGGSRTTSGLIHAVLWTQRCRH